MWGVWLGVCFVVLLFVLLFCYVDDVGEVFVVCGLG